MPKGIYFKKIYKFSPSRKSSLLLKDKGLISKSKHISICTTKNTVSIHPPKWALTACWAFLLACSGMLPSQSQVPVHAREVRKVSIMGKQRTIASFSCLFFLFFTGTEAAPSHIKLSFCHTQESMLGRICAACGGWCGGPQEKLKGHRGKHQYTQQDALQTSNGGRMPDPWGSTSEHSTGCHQNDSHTHTPGLEKKQKVLMLIPMFPQMSQNSSPGQYGYAVSFRLVPL